jgi:hypothetical protein
MIKLFLYYFKLSLLYLKIIKFELRLKNKMITKLLELNIFNT